MKDELATRRRKNVVQARSFAEMLEQTLRRYQNRAVEAAQVIEEIIQLARELVMIVRGNVTIDWTVRENVRANLSRLVKRILRKHGYPPDKQEKATRTVLEQAEALSAGWAAGPRALDSVGTNWNVRTLIGSPTMATRHRPLEKTDRSEMDQWPERLPLFTDLTVSEIVYV